VVLRLCMPMDIFGHMKRISLFLPEKMLESLSKLSDKTGAPVAELVRRFIDAGLKEKSK
jgi:predicted DNA-binding protein